MNNGPQITANIRKLLIDDLLLSAERNFAAFRGDLRPLAVNELVLTGPDCNHLIIRPKQAGFGYNSPF
ncbi:MAG: hypothetical protein AB2729_16955 [Candidatus Thiodiazotropha taylori]